MKQGCQLSVMVTKDSTFSQGLYHIIYGSHHLKCGGSFLYFEKETTNIHPFVWLPNYFEE